MNAKQMSNYALVFLLFAVNAIICELVFGGWLDGFWFFSVISTIFNISSAIKKDLEQIKEKLNQHNRG
ncbi:MAG: hypothetical protein GY941_17875 [Planctomycetes bacterium]|nr:hypothetical protein [Planctomycetota bacterium]